MKIFQMRKLKRSFFIGIKILFETNNELNEYDEKNKEIRKEEN